MGNSQGISRLISEKSLKKKLEIQDPNPAVVLEAAVAADREWGVWGGEAPPLDLVNIKACPRTGLCWSRLL